MAPDRAGGSTLLREVGILCSMQERLSLQPVFSAGRNCSVPRE